MASDCFTKYNGQTIRNQISLKFIYQVEYLLEKKPSLNDKIYEYLLEKKTSLNDKIYERFSCILTFLYFYNIFYSNIVHAGGVLH